MDSADQATNCCTESRKTKSKDREVSTTAVLANWGANNGSKGNLKFLDINLTKHSCLVRILKNTILYCEMVFLDIKIAEVSSLLLHATKKIREKRKVAG
jgi:hypothetical protein